LPSITESRTVFLDRDGVINRKLPEGRYVNSWDEFVFLPGVLEALADLADAGLRAVVVTNQRGVARGVVSEGVLDEIHRRMRAEIAASGGCVDAVYYCPHEGGCDCRKPRTGMLERAARELGLDLAEAVLIGDRLSDIQAGAAVGATTVLVPSDVDEPAARAMADFVAVDLIGAVRWVVGGRASSATVDAVLRNPPRVARPRAARTRMDPFSGQWDAGSQSKNDDGRSRT
jgi:D-glycero-D-manno-heptose 1,7-bisphosphate phosphatase